MTLRTYAPRKGWPLSGLRVRLAYERAPAAMESPVVDRIIRRIAPTGELDDPQRARLWTSPNAPRSPWPCGLGCRSRPGRTGDEATGRQPS
ncbi:hypothetical protein OHB49_42095 [Streptomyces sp. NBC_01717]